MYKFWMYYLDTPNNGGQHPPVDGGKKIFNAITLNFYIVVNKNYLYNYSEKIKL